MVVYLKSLKSFFEIAKLKLYEYVFIDKLQEKIRSEKTY